MFFIVAVPSIKPITVETKGEGENLTVTCEAMGYPPPIIVWTRTNGALSDRVLVSGNVTTLTDDGIVSKVSVTLSIANASREDKGEYRCFANNSVGSDVITVKITIESKFLNQAHTAFGRARLVS